MVRTCLRVGFINDVVQLKDGALFKWGVGLMVINPDSAFDGAYLKVSTPYSSG